MAAHSIQAAINIVQPACCILQMTCMNLFLAAAAQLLYNAETAAMSGLLEDCKVLHRAKVPAQDSRMVNNRQLFQNLKDARDGCFAKHREILLPTLGACFPPQKHASSLAHSCTVCACLMHSARWHHSH